MSITEKVAYLKGLAEGMDISKTSNEGKLLHAMLELLDEMAVSVDKLEFDMDVISSDFCEMNEDIDYLFDELNDSSDCDCDCDCQEDDYDDYDGEIYEISCPNCSQSILLDEDILDNGEINCFNCGDLIEIDFSGIIENDENQNT